MRIISLASIVLALVAVRATGDVFAFSDHEAFQQFNMTHNKLLKGIEDFEESTIDPGGKQILFDPLAPGMPNPPPDGNGGFPNGLAEPNVLIQTNVTPGPRPATPNPTSGVPTALYVVGAGFIGSNSNKVGEDLFLQGIHASVDLIFGEPEHTGIGFWLSRFAGFPNGGWDIGVFDSNNVLIGNFAVPAPSGPEPNKVFFGVWSDATIGRINLYDQAGPAPDAVDDIEMWVPEPNSLALLTAGLAIALRRRPRPA